MQKSPQFWDSLNMNARRACAKEPLLSFHPPETEVRIPHVAFRSSSDRRPPLADMIAAGRGAADVRIRLYLFVLALTRIGGPHPILRSTGDWALILNFIPEGRERNRKFRAQAARRVARAIDYLVDAELVRQPAQGQLHIAGYDLEKIEWSENRGRYVAVPVSLWTNGTISTLSGRANLALLALLDQEDEPGREIRMPRRRKTLYAVSNDTWYEGLKELEQFGLIHRVEGTKAFSAKANPKLGQDRYRTRWKVNHRSLTKKARLTF